MTLDQIKCRANEAERKASAEPNQSSYNAAWLHGYARALLELHADLLKEEAAHDRV